MLNDVERNCTNIKVAVIAACALAVEFVVAIIATAGAATAAAVH